MHIVPRPAGGRGRHDAGLLEWPGGQRAVRRGGRGCQMRSVCGWHSEKRPDRPAGQDPGVSQVHHRDVRGQQRDVGVCGVRQQAGGQRVHRVGGQPACHGGSGLPLVSRVLARLKRKHLTLGWQEVHRGLLQAGGGVQAVSNGPVVGDKGRDELPGVHERAQREPVLSEEAGHQHPHGKHLPVVSEGWRGHSLLAR